MGSIWTPELIDRLTALVATGATYSAIGATMGLTKSQVIAKAHRLNIDLRRDIPKPPPLIEFPVAGHCQWPHGDPGRPDFHFCGARYAGHPQYPYCHEHMTAALRRPGAEQQDEAA